MMKEKVFHLEDIELHVPAYLDKASRTYLYDYPIFTTEPMYTGAGRPCVNAWQEACGHVRPVEGITVKAMDCGCCVHYCTERERDLVGVCMCDQNRICGDRDRAAPCAGSCGNYAEKNLQGG